jgi:FtsP/CotA-like multicopper oxidase with cupredoxin domain
VLPGGTFPGPVIRGNKGDRFKINVVDRLSDPTMLRSTSIVRHTSSRIFELSLISLSSIGTGYFSKQGRTGPMAHLSLPNVLLPRTIRSSMIFKRSTKLALSGITLICVSH